MSVRQSRNVDLHLRGPGERSNLLRQRNPKIRNKKLFYLLCDKSYAIIVIISFYLGKH